MPSRYVVMAAEDARAQNVSDAPEKPESDWDYDHAVLVDTERNTVVWQDWDVGDTPEDMYLHRNLRTFVDELNRLAEEVQG
jgi:hypothetical protein